jgi:hypothetical protein
MNRFTVLIALGAAIGLTACADISPSPPATATGASGPMQNSYAYPSSFGNSFGRYGYHPLPYDNTGYGPGETGLQGGGG